MGASSNRNNGKEISRNHENEIISYNLYEDLLCSKCGEIPEILKIHTDNSKIEFNCKNCGEYEIVIDEYFDRLFKNNYFKKCNYCESKGLTYNFYYCFLCKKDYCQSCKNKNHSNHQCIEIDEKKRFCLKHNKEFSYFCFDCQENCCEYEIEMEHRNHKIIEISQLNYSLYEYPNKIIEINNELKNLVEFNNLILKNEEIFQNKDFYVNSIINMGKSLKEGNERNSKDIKFLLNVLSKDIENSMRAIDTLKDEKGIYLRRKNKYIYLNNRNLDDRDFKYISQIRFNQLKEIDISENNITNVEPFKKMSLPFLEILNLSYNKINHIEPVTKIKSKNLQYIFLQNNKMEDLESFIESNFPALRILRVENNNINEKNGMDEETKVREILNKINNKYPGKFIYKSMEEQIKEFKNKYELEISEDKENIDLCDLKGGDEMIKNLFLIASYKPKNKIKKLILRNNDIKDPTMLSKINFNKLQILDLASNEIKDLSFLQNMKSENLKFLYLDNNHFNNIYPILNANFPNLEFLSLNENNFNYDNIEQIPGYFELKNKQPKNGKQFIIQFELKKDLNKKGSISKNQFISKNEFLCPECGQLPPEISNINVDNKKIEFRCKKCGEKEYEAKFLYHEFHDNTIYYYCKPIINNGENKYWFKEYTNKTERLSNNKNCLNKTYSNDILEKSKEIIKQKNKELEKIIKFNKIIIGTREKYPNNYFFIKSLKNITNSLQKEKLRDSKDLKFLFTALNNEIEISDKAIENFLDEKDIKIERQEENLILSKKKLNDENIKCISLIKFNQLKEINLSENEIINIDLICNMNLPFLEFLNLSYNKIRNIEPLGELNPKKLKYLFIQNNQIEDVEVLKNCDFPKLKILRLENNNIQENSISFKEIVHIYNKYNKIIVTQRKIEEIKKLYNIEYHEKTQKIELEGVEEEKEREEREEDDEEELILKNLFIIITQKNENRIRKLKLANNKIKNPSILNRIQFNFLEELDLSLNNIKNLKFLKGMKAKNLKTLYLNNNCIKDLSSLINNINYNLIYFLFYFYMI